ncbi:MAG: hypothetical protein PHN88_01520 [Ignavibacteria bacterium]|nr:hypothetical protein [Ignavibacteria bacterium]
MKRFILLYLAAIFLTLLMACNTQVKEKDSRTNTSNNTTKPESKESIPDSVIQFLINSAAMDFNEHQAGKIIDVRNVKAGYTTSGDRKSYLVCGEFLSKEKNEWDQFTTIKTSGYEQYLGRNIYCQDATFTENDSKRITEEIKNKLTGLKK